MLAGDEKVNFDRETDRESDKGFMGETLNKDFLQSHELEDEKRKYISK